MTDLPFRLAQPAQGFLTGGAQRRQVDLHNVPKPIFPDGVVFVAQAVAERSDLLPRLTGDKGCGQIAQFRCGFANPF